jgi:hypothetical protein
VDLVALAIVSSDAGRVVDLTVEFDPTSLPDDRVAPNWRVRRHA